MDGGFKESPLKLNAGLGQLDQWNEDAIKARAERLSALAAELWATPRLSDEILAQYQKIDAAPAGFSIDDHPHLLSGPMRQVFEAFRKEVLALNPCVSEEFRKLYVAYKAETNFVDVVPQAKRLRLSINMAYADINDPKGLCRDVTNLGRWGNGDIEVGLSEISEVPYVMGLVRQSFERQMGNEGNA
jgi:predicted transport protein